MTQSTSGISSKPLEASSFNFSELTMIGKGGYGEVCSAKIEKTGSPIAIKRMAKSAQARAEASMLTTLKSDHAVRCRGIFEDRDDKPNPKTYIVMDLIPAKDMFSTFVQKDPDPSLNFAEVITITKQLLEFFLDLKKRQITYFDLKPSNLIFTRPARSLTVIDLGAARSMPLGPSETVTSTHAYRPPEFILGKPLYTDFDLWSLACTVFEIITREQLFHVPREIPQERRDNYHLQMIVHQIGPLTRPYCANAAWAEKYLDESLQFHQSEVLQETRSWKTRIFEVADKKDWPATEVRMFVNMLSEMLRYKNRSTPEVLLKHLIFKSEITIHLNCYKSVKCLMSIQRASQTDKPDLFMNFKYTFPTCLHVPKDPKGKYLITLKNEVSSIQEVFSLGDHTTLDIRSLQETPSVPAPAAKRCLTFTKEENKVNVKDQPPKKKLRKE